MNNQLHRRQSFRKPAPSRWLPIALFLALFLSVIPSGPADAWSERAGPLRAESDPPYTTSISIGTISSAQPQGILMVGFAAWTPVTVSNTTDDSSDIPTGSVTVSSGGVSCSFTLQDGAGHCALFFTSSGAKSIEASYTPDSIDFLPSSSPSPATATIQPLALSPSLSAGRNHTCYLNANGDFICWGLADMFPYTFDGEEQIPQLVNEVTQVSAGGYHTCALKTDGTIQCWGDDPAIVDNVPTGKFLSLSAGNEHVCAIDLENKLQCWGTLSASLANIPADEVSAISAGHDHDCAIKKSDSKALCWGESEGERLDAPNTALKTLAVGKSHTCAITAADTVLCWGSPALTPPGGSNFVQIGSGSDYSCARNSSAGLSCWGSGAPTIDPNWMISDFSSGFLHTCALIENGAGGHFLACAGNNTFEQAPRITMQPDDIPNYLPLNRPWLQSFSADGGASPYTLTLFSGALPPGVSLVDYDLVGTPNTLGSYDFELQFRETFANSDLALELFPRRTSFSAEVQNPDTTISMDLPAETIPVGAPVDVGFFVSKIAAPDLSGTVTVTSSEATATCQASAAQGSCTIFFSTPGVKNIQAVYNGDSFYNASSPDIGQVTISPIIIDPVVSAGNHFNCSIDANGAPFCWGIDDADQSNPPAGKIFTQLSAGDAHVCGRAPNGQISCWGWNGFGAAQPPADPGFLSVASGATHSCALFFDGSVECWGNSSGDRTTPPSGVAFTQISAGADHTCGLDASGKAYCWGVDAYGQAAPPAGASYSQVSAGGFFSCGLLSTTSAVECWGGDGVIDSIRSEPGGTFKDISAGFRHACAIRDDDTITCWGDNTNNQTANPAGTFHSVSAGYDHTCALRTDGRLLCWGENTYGQAPVISLLPAFLPSMDYGVSAAIDLLANGGRTANYSFSHSGDLPLGVALDSTSGTISGVPTSSGVFDFTVNAVESDLTPALIGEKAYTLIVRTPVSVEITDISPEQAMVGKAIAVSVKVEPPPGDPTALTPSGIASLSVDGATVMTTTLVDGEGTAYLFFTAPGERSISASYQGDSYFLPGDSDGDHSVSVNPFQQSPAIETGLDRTFIHLSDGTLVCEGSNCEQGNLTGVYTQIQVSDALVCALRTDGKAQCKTNADTPYLKDGPFSSLSAGVDHICAIHPEGHVSCWWEGEDGITPTPAKAVSPGGAFSALSAAAGYTCGIRASGSIACWGAAPTPLPTGVFESLSAGPGHVCAIRDDQTAICWGDNTDGQSAAPAGTYQAVQVGAAHSCALNTSGQIVCWGQDLDGKIDPPYSGAGEVFGALSAYANHNCALIGGPRLACWGGNEYGEAPRITFDPLTTDEIVATQYWEHFFNPAGGVKPLEAAVLQGILPPDVQLSVNLSPAGVVLYGVPQVPGVFPFTLGWEDSSPIPLFVHQPYSLTVTGGDLSATIHPAHAETALYQNEFTFEYEFTNATALPVPDVLIQVNLPNGLEAVQISGIPGCTQADTLLTCSLASFEAFSSLNLAVSGLVTASPGTTIQTNAQIQPQLSNWPELAPSDNSDDVAIQAALQNLVFTDTFDTTPRSDEWSDGAVITSTLGVTYLGDFGGNDSLRLVLEDLPPHKMAIVNFDLFVIGPWQGNTVIPPNGVGRWQFGMTGITPVIDTTFCNIDACQQAYPENYPSGDNPWRTGASGSDELGFPGVVDTRYHFSIPLLHSSDILDILFASFDLPQDAMWGLENVQVILDYTAPQVFLPLLRR